jgi:DNA-3-methyladenine glycosylase
MRVISRKLFQSDPVRCAREMIGCRITLGECSGIIVETEAYAAEGDPACHTWKRPSARDFVFRNPPGTAYVYLNYGMHWLLNFLVKGGEQDGFVLIRALEPIAGLDVMRERRKRIKTNSVNQLCNGPGKLTQALGITGIHHECDPLSRDDWELFHPMTPVKIIDSTRIGISQATDRHWRFLLKGSRCVSFPPEKAKER